MLCLHNACGIIHEMFLVDKFETFPNCKEVKHIMIMIIAIIYIFFYLLRYLINRWKLLSENPQPPLNKIHPLFLLTPPVKIQNV